MNKIFIYFLSFLLICGTSCTDVLDQSAVDAFDEDVVFSDINLVKAYVGACYSMIGSTKQDGENSRNSPMQRRDLLTCSTDHSLNTMRAGQEPFLVGNLSADNLGMFNNNDNGRPWLFWTNQYLNIQNLNTIIARIDDVPVGNQAETTLRSRLKGEAYFLRALSYSHLLMMYGGVVISDKPYKMTDNVSDIKRSSLAATKDFILSDVAQAIALLPTKSQAGYEQGRANQAAAAAIKSRVLMFCASKLANGGFAAGASNELVSFPSGSQTALLQAARDAAKDIMDGKYGAYSLVGNTAEPPSPLTEAQVQEYADNFFYVFYQKLGSVWHSEMIWGIQHTSTEAGRTFQPNKWFGPSGYHGFGNDNPTEDVVRRFEMADGSKFVWHTSGDKFAERYATAAELAANPLLNPYNGREPRFYASILYHGAPWIERPPEGKPWDPYNRIQTGHKYRSRTDVDPAIRGIDTRQAPFNDWNATKIGYYQKKYLDPGIPASQTQSVFSTHAWIEYRYAEILLNYAEACIELGGADLQAGINALNLVRRRAGLPSRVTTNQAEARAFVRHEREIEFFGEGQRFFDMRRWMVCNEVVVNVYPIIVKEYIDTNNALTGMSWQLRSNQEDTRKWGGDHFYWFPIHRAEMNKAKGLVQNPGYN